MRLLMLIALLGLFKCSNADSTTAHPMLALACQQRIEALGADGYDDITAILYHLASSVADKLQVTVEEAMTVCQEAHRALHVPSGRKLLTNRRRLQSTVTPATDGSNSIINIPYSRRLLQKLPMKKAAAAPSTALVAAEAAQAAAEAAAEAQPDAPTEPSVEIPVPDEEVQAVSSNENIVQLDELDSAHSSGRSASGKVGGVGVGDADASTTSTDSNALKWVCHKCFELFGGRGGQPTAPSDYDM